MRWQRLLRRLAPVLLIGTLCLPAARAQAPSEPAAGETAPPRRGPLAQYTLALLFSTLVLVIVFFPRWKR